MMGLEHLPSGQSLGELGLLVSWGWFRDHPEAPGAYGEIIEKMTQGGRMRINRRETQPGALFTHEDRQVEACLP